EGEPIELVSEDVDTSSELHRQPGSPKGRQSSMNGGLGGADLLRNILECRACGMIGKCCHHRENPVGSDEPVVLTRCCHMSPRERIVETASAVSPRCGRFLCSQAIGRGATLSWTVPVEGPLPAGENAGGGIARGRRRTDQ